MPRKLSDDRLVELVSRDADGNLTPVGNVVTLGGSAGSGGSTGSGEGHIGEVSNNLYFASFTLSLDTSAYASGDVLADTQVLTDAMRVTDGTGALLSLILNDKDDQGAPLDLLILNANVALGTENAAPSISDTNADNILGIVSVVAGDWVDLGGCRVATIPASRCGFALKAVSATKNLYIAAITRGTPTHTASGVTGKLAIERN